MKNKRVLIINLFYSILTTLSLLYFFYKTTNGKFLLIPFLISSFSMVLKNIFILIKKENYIKVFNKIFVIGFLLFWFGFLICWCNLAFKSKDYLLILFSIPFWLAGINLTKKYLSKTQKSSNNYKKSKFNFKVIVGILLVLIGLSTGIIMLFFGIKDTYQLNQKTKNYITINGYFNDYEIYNRDEDGTTYKLTYIYVVDNKEYSITTDYGTNYIPDKNSIREIKYNPNSPEDAILVGTNNENGLIFMGVFFTLVSFTFIIGALSVVGYFNKFKVDILGTYIGIVFLVIGLGIIIFQTSTTMSLTETIKSFSLWILIPVMFIVIGIYQIVKCLFLNKRKYSN